MGKSEKQIDKEHERNQRIIDTAFRLFVEKKIEAVSMDEVAKEAGVGRATLFRCYNNKTELAIAVCASKWKDYLDKLDEVRPISSIHDIPAIGRFIFTLDSYIGMYQNHKNLLQYNDNFNNYITHQTVRQEELANFHASLNSVNTRLHMMYAKAKEDKTFRTDIPEEQFSAYHDGSVYSLRRWFYLGSNGQQGLYRRSAAFKGNDPELCPEWHQSLIDIAISENL